MSNQKVNISFFPHIWLIFIIFDLIVPFSALQMSFSSFKLAVSFSKSRHLLFTSFNSLLGKERSRLQLSKVMQTLLFFFSAEED